MTPESRNSYVEQTFVDLDLRSAILEDAEFDACLFERCLLSEAGLKRSRFVDCLFKDSDLSLAQVTDASFRDVRFEGCKVSGVNWALAANPITGPLGLDFEDCDISFSSFMKLDFGKRRLLRCMAREAYFAETDLSGADCRDSDFSGSTFLNANLKGADFRSARNYAIDVRNNLVEGARFSLPEALSLLQGLGIELG